MSKSKITIDPDEFLLGQMIAEVKSRGWKSCQAMTYAHQGKSCSKESATQCCVLGAARLVGRGYQMPGMVFGNDLLDWTNVCFDESDRGESIGWAYYQACED